MLDIRIPHIGAGHCALIKMPDDKYVIHDAASGARLNGDRTIAPVREYIPAGSGIGLMVLSHTGADHQYRLTVSPDIPRRMHYGLASKKAEFTTKPSNNMD